MAQMPMVTLDFGGLLACHVTGVQRLKICYRPRNCLTYRSIDRKILALGPHRADVRRTLKLLPLITADPIKGVTSAQTMRLKRQKESPMRFGRVVNTVLVGMTVLLWMASASAQQVRYFPDFSSVANLQMNGSAHQATYNSAKVLRLTDGYPGVGATHPETSSAWFELPPSVDVDLGRQSVNTGFTTYFKFQIHTAAICCTPADGFAFVIQNSSATALGTGSGGLGYAGIPNSLAIEFDTYQNPWDPNANHVAVQSCGTGANAPSTSVGNCLVGSGINSSSSIPTLGRNLWHFRTLQRRRNARSGHRVYAARSAAPATVP